MVFDLYRHVIIAVVRGSYTAAELRQFVQLCANLARPLIRKRISSGKIRLITLRFSEKDMIFDCLADLFERDDSGQFVQIQRFFQQELPDLDSASTELMVEVLRRIAFQKVSNGLIRLYSNADPVLAKILHNLDVAIHRSQFFTKQVRMGEKWLFPVGSDVLQHLPPMPFETFHLLFSRVAVIHDSMTEVLRKIHDIVSNQSRYQRSVSFMTVGYLARELYALQAVPQETATESASAHLEADDLSKMIDRVCGELRNKTGARYKIKGKLDGQLFDYYMRAVKEILRDMILSKEIDGSFFEYLRRQLPNLTPVEYKKNHRTRIEYLVKSAKNSLRREWKHA